MTTYTDRRAAHVRPSVAPLAVTRVRHREPRPEWQAELDRIAEPAEQISSLKILWEPGDDWAPVERWVIWQVYKAGAVPLLVRDAIAGPHPRTTGHACFVGWCRCDVKATRWVDGPSESFGITARQWELFRDTGRFHQRWWVMQGDRGGHRIRYDRMEEIISVTNGGPKQPPALGELPYAEPDTRTWAAIGAADLIRRYKKTCDFVLRSMDDLAREDAERAWDAQQAVWSWLDNQLHAPAERLAHAIKHADDSLVPRAAPWAPSTALIPEKTEEAFMNNSPYAPLAA